MNLLCSFIIFVSFMFNMSAGHPSADKPAGEGYIVVMEKQAAEKHKLLKRDDKDLFALGDKFMGYKIHMSQEAVDDMKAEDGIAVLEKDSYDEVQSVLYKQDDPSWGLSRISHLMNGANEYIFRSEAGKGPVIYVVDTGVVPNHRELRGRLRMGPNYVNDVNTDENGHGTHVAGIAAGYSVGVAKFARVVAVKVLDKDRRGAVSSFVKAVSWIIQDHQANPGQKSVINYSAVGDISQARNMAVNEAINAGILFVGAAGNKGEDACNYGPPSNARNKAGQLVVASVNDKDEPSSFSNFGACVDVYAPGEYIRSSFKPNEDSYGLMSGTSMASPHIAGLAAYYWSLDDSLSLADISKAITDGNQNKIKNAKSGTVNKLAYNDAEN